MVPAVNQIEVHPYFEQRGGARVRRRARHPHRGLVADRAGWGAERPDDHRASPSGWAGRRPRSMLRWHIQRGDIVFPKSTTPARIAENFAIFDFELTDDDMTAITALDKGEEGGPAPTPTRIADITS